MKSLEFELQSKLLTRKVTRFVFKKLNISWVNYNRSNYENFKIIFSLKLNQNSYLILRELEEATIKRIKYEIS